MITENTENRENSGIAKHCARCFVVIGTYVKLGVPVIMKDRFDYGTSFRTTKMFVIVSTRLSELVVAEFV